MADTLIALLISEQTVPNVQFLKWFFSGQKQTVDLLFMSTEKMEEKKKSLNIINALECSETHIASWKVIKVEENNVDDVYQKLDDLFSDWQHESFILNMTGGTKLMSLAAYTYFQDKEDIQIFYQPINQNLQRIYPEYQKYSIPDFITVEEYMKAHGIDFKYDNFCLKDYDYNKTVYKNVIEENREFIKPIVAMQNNSYFKSIFKRKDTIDFLQVPDEKFVTPQGERIDKENVCSTISKFGFDVTNVSKAELKYITGGWFEEFVYQKIKAELNLADKKIALNVHIEKENDKNELDVVYIKNNQLHVIECKSFLDGEDGSKILTDALYKLQAIIKSKFGLNAKSYLYTQSVITKESALNRAKEFGIEIVDGTKL